jgi:hypothetical protein
VSDEQFLAAWRAWDAHPGRVAEGAAFEEACQAKASELRLSTSTLRDLLAAFRRAGYARPVCLAALRGAIGEIAKIGRSRHPSAHRVS